MRFIGTGREGTGNSREKDKGRSPAGNVPLFLGPLLRPDRAGPRADAGALRYGPAPRPDRAGPGAEVGGRAMQLSRVWMRQGRGQALVGRGAVPRTGAARLLRCVGNGGITGRTGDGTGPRGALGAPSRGRSSDRSFRPRRPGSRTRRAGPAGRASCRRAGPPCGKGVPDTGAGPSPVPRAPAAGRRPGAGPDAAAGRGGR